MTSKHVQIAASPDYYTDYFSSAFQGLNDKLKFGSQNRGSRSKRNHRLITYAHFSRN